MSNSTQLDFYTGSGSLTEKVSLYVSIKININVLQINYLDKYTSTLYCPTGNLVVPYKEKSSSNLSDGQDVTLEVDAFGNQYLHLILPAEKLNFLNGLNGSNSFFNNFNGSNA